jgi:putative transposase
LAQLKHESSPEKEESCREGSSSPKDAQRLRALEEENRKLKLLLAEQLLDVRMLRSALSKK